VAICASLHRRLVQPNRSRCCSGWLSVVKGWWTAVNNENLTMEVEPINVIDIIRRQFAMHTYEFHFIYVLRWLAVFFSWQLGSQPIAVTQCIICFWVWRECLWSLSTACIMLLIVECRPNVEVNLYSVISSLSDNQVANMQRFFLHLESWFLHNTLETCFMFHWYDVTFRVQMKWNIFP